MWRETFMWLSNRATLCLLLLTVGFFSSLTFVVWVHGSDMLYQLIIILSDLQHRLFCTVKQLWSECATMLCKSVQVWHSKRCSLLVSCFNSNCSSDHLWSCLGWVQIFVARGYNWLDIFRFQKLLLVSIRTTTYCCEHCWNKPAGDCVHLSFGELVSVLTSIPVLVSVKARSPLPL